MRRGGSREATPRRRRLAARTRRHRSPAPEPTSVTLISDATGALGEHVLQAVFTQFQPGAFRLRKIPFVNDEAALAQCLAQLRRASGLVVHATIYQEFKRRIEAVCHDQGLPVYDLTGPIMGFIASASGRQVDVNYRKLHDLTPDYFKRVGAIQFAIAHDDGRGLRTLPQAEIILTGVSRTTKTPTNMVLAMHGYRVANVPIVPELDLPAELLRVEPRRVICLTMESAALASVRVARVREELGFDGGYADTRAIRQELVLARRLCHRHGWRELNVTGRAVEETAALVLEAVGVQPAS